uniref:uncharacterized protein LOC100178657 isoform X1 n=1 Tax=Ciona intestinalis TaxID=7719 RepID=UPI0002B8E4B6|nr:uncharacterized protein LOC100178657 isoform X1 [Ciona intestinalis]|eukprot:XP_026695845.1 uncharacterized protein LOC100178657 isoform X1 [Ciona intestinalis]
METENGGTTATDTTHKEKIVHSMDEVNQTIKDFETSSQTKFLKHSGKIYDNTPQKSKVFWRVDDTGDMVPYFTTGFTKYICIHSRDRHSYLSKKCTSEKDKLLRMQKSKKRDCGATISVSHMVQFPELKKPTNVAIYQKTLATRFIKYRLTTDNNIKQEPTFRIVFPQNTDHSGHVIGGQDIKGEMDERLVLKIDEYVSNGVSNVKHIMNNLEKFVTEDLFKDGSIPLLSNKRYFPTAKAIKRQYHKSFLQKQLCEYDQDTLMRDIDHWKQEISPEDNILFRPFIPTPPIDKDDTLSSLDHQFLFVHQLGWQRELLHRYGNDFCFLDFTVKQTRFALPLHFLCVKTNYSHQVVATFVTQENSVRHIAEALDILKHWCENWEPKFIFTDNNEARTEAIEQVFSGCKVLISELHKERAWLKRGYLSDAKVTPEAQEQIVALLKEIAHSEDEASFQKSHDELMNREDSKMNSKLQSYLNSWFSIKERWCWLYWPEDIRILMLTNYGLERHHNLFEDIQTKFRPRKVLPFSISFLHKHFLPEHYKQYRMDNSSSFKLETSDFMPADIAQHLCIKEHCIRQLSEANSRQPDCIECDCDEFTLKYEDGTATKVIIPPSNFPRCSCAVYRASFLPCFHIFTLFPICENFSWASLPCWFRDSVFLSLDPHVCNLPATVQVMIEQPSELENETVEHVLELSSVTVSPSSPTTDLNTDIRRLLDQIQAVCESAPNEELATTKTDLEIILYRLQNGTDNACTLNRADVQKRKTSTQYEFEPEAKVRLADFSSN